MIIWASPELKNDIIARITRNTKGLTSKEKEIENKQVVIDPL